MSARVPRILMVALLGGAAIAARRYRRDLARARALAPRAYLHRMGVPRGLALAGEAGAFVDQMADSIFPVGPRAAGAAFDAFVGNADVHDYPLEAITVPTLLVHAQDDPLTSYVAAERAADRIPGAQLLTLPSGGHLLIGQDDAVSQAISAFLTEPITTSSQHSHASPGGRGA